MTQKTLKTAWIRTTGETEATGYVKNLYQSFKKQRGWIPNILKATTIRPPPLEAGCRSLIL